MIDGDHKSYYPLYEVPFITRSMIDLNEVRPSEISVVDGQLDDGRLVEFKANFPNNFDSLMPLIVAMANQEGGIIVFGIQEMGRTIVGIKKEPKQAKREIDNAIDALSLGIIHFVIPEVVDERIVVYLYIEKAKSTAFFIRKNTSPNRQIAYRFKEGEGGRYTISGDDKMYYAKVYKYMTLESFLSSLYCGTLRFSEPSTWNDRFEQRFYCATYDLPEAKGKTPKLYATCLTRKRNSEAAWKVYAHGQGLGTHCVQLQIDIEELRKQIRSFGLIFEEKPITYISEREILELHDKNNPSFQKYFGSFTLQSFLSLLSLKRDAYAYEQELRLFLIPNDGGERNLSNNAEDKDLKIDWSKVITKVWVDKKCSKAELVSIQSACFEAGINPVIKDYEFLGKRSVPSGLKDIVFERYDIDEMPGSSRITIPKP